MSTSTPSPTGNYPFQPQVGESPLPTAVPAVRPVDDPAAGLPYFHTLRPVQPGRWWRSLLGIIVVVFGYLILSTVFGIAAIVFDNVTGSGNGWTMSSSEMRLTPSLMVAVTAAPALMIPLVAVFERLLYGRSGRLHSVIGRIRWRFLGRLALILVPLMAIYLTIFSIAGPQPGGKGPAAAWPALLIIIVLLVPFQAAGEEYAVRGFLARIVGSWFASARIALAAGTVLPSLVFMLAHGAADPWLWLYYFTFGATMAIVAWQTGGLEGPVVLHAANNVVLFIVAILLTDTAGSFDRSVGVGGPFMLIQIVALAVFGLLAIVIGRRSGVAIQVPERGLEESAS
jgi:membrane protease YdiL (CAAX protease family)